MGGDQCQLVGGPGRRSGGAMLCRDVTQRGLAFLTALSRMWTDGNELVGQGPQTPISRYMLYLNAPSPAHSGPPVACTG